MSAARVYAQSRSACNDDSDAAQENDNISVAILGTVFARQTNNIKENAPVQALTTGTVDSRAQHSASTRLDAMSSSANASPIPTQPPQSSNQSTNNAETPSSSQTIDILPKEPLEASPAKSQEQPDSLSGREEDVNVQHALANDASDNPETIAKVENSTPAMSAVASSMGSDQDNTGKSNAESSSLEAEDVSSLQREPSSTEDKPAAKTTNPAVDTDQSRAIPAIANADNSVSLDKSGGAQLAAMDESATTTLAAPQFSAAKTSGSEKANDTNKRPTDASTRFAARILANAQNSDSKVLKGLAKDQGQLKPEPSGDGVEPDKTLVPLKAEVIPRTTSTGDATHTEVDKSRSLAAARLDTAPVSDVKRRSTARSPGPTASSTPNTRTSIAPTPSTPTVQLVTQPAVAQSAPANRQSRRGLNWTFRLDDPDPLGPAF